MLPYRKHSMVSAIALAFGLSACGGGGGGPRSMPPPPTGTPSPTPTPTPTPTATVQAPASPTAVGTFPAATSGGPTMQSHGSTSFPLLETVMTNTSGVGSPDTAANTGGASLITTATGSLSTDQFRLVVPGLGYDVSMVSGGFYCYSLACGGSGGRFFELFGISPYASNLSWTTFGAWSSGGGTSFNWAAYATGYATPVGAIPTTGSATYNGEVTGNLALASGPDVQVCIGCIGGSASLLANFGSGSITGALTNMTAAGQPWNNVSLTGTITSGVNAFSGTTAVTSTPPGAFTMSSSAVGTFAGKFFGPSAQELGAVWTLYDGTKAVTGAIGAKTGP